MAVECRKVDCRRPLTAVTEMTDWSMGLFWTTEARFQFRSVNRAKDLSSPPTLGGWDLTMKLEPPERANKIMNKGIQEISAKKRATAIARDYGAITDTDGFVRIMGCDLFRRPGFSLVRLEIPTNGIENNLAPVDPENMHGE